MRTSIDIPDELFKAAKREAVERETSFKALVIGALQKELGVTAAEQQMPYPQALPVIRVVKDCPALQMQGGDFSAADAEADSV